MPVCAVPMCATTHRAPDKTLYRFPKDVYYARIWVRCCMRKDSFNTKSAFICSLHFADEAYRRDINYDVLGYSSKKNLRKDAVPTLELPSLRMFHKDIVSQDAKDASLLNDIPALSPKHLLKNVTFDLFSWPRNNKTRVKFHQAHLKHRRCSSSDHIPDSSFTTEKEHTDIEDVPDKNDSTPESRKMDGNDGESHMLQ